MLLVEWRGSGSRIANLDAAETWADKKGDLGAENLPKSGADIPSDTLALALKFGPTRGKGISVTSALGPKTSHYTPVTKRLSSRPVVRSSATGPPRLAGAKSTVRTVPPWRGPPLRWPRGAKTTDRRSSTLVRVSSPAAGKNRLSLLSDVSIAARIFAAQLAGSFMQPLARPLEDDPAVDFLKSRINYERTSRVPYPQRDFRLDRMRQLLLRLGNPQDALRIVHIAGTKGKGSTAAMIAGALCAAGYRTGLFSSPHLDRVEERIAIDAEPCSSDELARHIARIQPVVAAMDELPTADPRESNRPTYFEIVTALALLCFAERNVEAAVLEVGLGGRLDSTNLCQPLLSVITSISYDHTQQLGTTLAEIASEKAGIIKPGVPLVSGVLGDEPREVVTRVAADHGCRMLQLGRDFDFRYRPPRGLEIAPDYGRMDFMCRDNTNVSELLDLELSLLGSHQAANAAVGIAAIGELRRLGWKIPDAAVRTGLRGLRWPARIEVISRDPLVVLDSAHNVASVDALVRVLAQSFSPGPRLLVFATTRDKDVRGMLRVLLRSFDEVIFTRYQRNPRAVDPRELAAIAGQTATARVHVSVDPVKAWDLAVETAGRQHLICVTGSFFIAAEMRAAILNCGT